jgi:hypothetical protein
MYKLLLVFPLALSTFAANPIILGARGGMSITNSNDYLTNAAGLSNRSYAIGPTVGFRLPLGFSVEGDALFHRQTLGLPQIGGFNLLNTHQDSWEIPVMAKFTVGHSAVAPVFGAGMSFRHINNFGNLSSYLLSGTTSQNSVGFVAGGGIRFKTGPLNITPELRYTRWNGSGLAQSLLNVISPNRNQAEVLIGITF